MYKAVFLDLDGTLLDDKSNISEKKKSYKICTKQRWISL